MSSKPCEPYSLVNSEFTSAGQLHVLPCLRIRLASPCLHYRTIYWFFSKEGNVGKTTFCKYLYKTFDCCIIGGKATDSKNCIASYIENSDDKRAPDIVVASIPRSQDDQFFSYEGLESIKDMFFYSGKYEGAMVCDNCPHVFVFSNDPPNRSKCSEDRWKIFEILDTSGNYEEWNGSLID
jgi:hypothetical protein